MLHLAQRIYNLLDEVAVSDKTYILVAHNGIARVVQSYFYEMTNENTPHLVWQIAQWSDMNFKRWDSCKACHRNGGLSC